MRKVDFLAIPVLAVAFVAPCAAAEKFKPEAIIALERSALDRYITSDPQGYLDVYAPEVTYFDPAQEGRVDGLEAMKALLAPVKNRKGAIKDPRYEMIAPKVQHHGDVAVLTFNIVNYGKRPTDQKQCSPGGIPRKFMVGLPESGRSSTATGPT
jgi:ketosteroid isomerase-like protein